MEFSILSGQNSKIYATRSTQAHLPHSMIFGECVIYTDQEIISLSPESIDLFDGYAHVESRLLFREDIGPKNLNELLSATGCFSAILAANDRVTILADYFGQYHLYEYTGGGVQIISNNKLGLTRLVRTLGLPLSLDMLEISFHLMSDLNLNTASLLNSTYFNEIKLCDPSCFYTISRIEGLKKQVRSTFYNVGGNYESLIKETVGEIEANVAGIASSSRVDDINIMVSGGRDSRMMLAAIDRSRPDLPIYSHTNGQLPLDDVRIGHALAEAMGIPDNRTSSSPKRKPATANDVWEYYTSAYFGHVTETVLPRSFSPSRTAKLVGGGGEMYRANMSKLFRWDDFAKPINDVVLSKMSSLNFINIVKDDVATEYAYRFLDFVLETGDDVYALEHSYIRGRQRYHFGHHLKVLFGAGALQFYPLVSRYAMHTFAAQSPSDIMNFRLLNEVTFRLSPTLHAFEYQNEKSRRGVDGFANTPIILSDEYARKRISLTSNTRLPRNKSGQTETQKIINKRQSIGMDSLESILDWGELRNYINVDKMRGRFTWRESKNDRHYGWWLEKFIAIERARKFLMG